MSALKRVMDICAVIGFYLFEWMVVATVATVGIDYMKLNYGFVYWQIFLVLWVLNTLFAWSIVSVSDRTGRDFTVMKRAEKLLFDIKQKSGFLKVTSIVFGICLVTWNAFWNGPAQVFLLLRRNVWVYNNKWIVLIAVSALQMALWTEVYLVGYDNVMPILQQLMADYI